MRNDKMGEASVPQNQTTVCNCPPPLSGFSVPLPVLPFYLPLSFTILICVWCGLGSSTSVHTKSIHPKCIASAAAAVAAVTQARRASLLNVWDGFINVQIRGREGLT